MPNSVPRRFTKLYILALSLVAFLTILGQILIQHTLSTQLNDSWLVNHAGRQRFQSQQIAKTVLLLTERKTLIDTVAYLADLKKIVANWEHYHHVLKMGEAKKLGFQVENSDSIKILFEQIDPNFRAISENVRQIISMLDDPEYFNQEDKEKSIKLIFDNELLFLKKMDKIVFQYDKEAKEKVNRLRKIEGFLLGITIFILTLEGLFIFRPAVNTLRKKIFELIDSEQQTAEANCELQATNEQLQETIDLLAKSNHLLEETREKLLTEGNLRHNQEINHQKMKTAALIQGQEEERKRLSRELHDGLGQMLTGLKLLSENIISLSSLPEKEQKAIGKLKTLIVSTIQETRNISNNLMPPVLSDFGIESALRELVEQETKNSGSAILFHANLNGKRFDKNIEIGLFRIAQEGMHNAVKHSGAEEIELAIFLKNNYLELSIEDNGRGFRSKKDKNPKIGQVSHGLQNIQERARLMDAQIEILSSIGNGTRVWVSVMVK